MIQTESIEILRDHIARWRGEGARIGFVPTMGNLHAGHLRLIEVAREHCACVVASIFVNPLQFGPGEDFARYPRTPDADCMALERAGTDLAFMPDVPTMYPRPLEYMTRVAVPELSAILEGAHRPGHFDGVTTVVARLFNLVQPDVAVFGEKDWQQFAIIRRMVADLGWPIELVGVPTVREPDGLAMSSRNGYLSATERQQAPQLQRELATVAAAVRAGERDYGALCADAMRHLKMAGWRVDYVELRDAATLAGPTSDSRRLVVLGAAWLGTTRLIDNVDFDLPASARP